MKRQFAAILVLGLCLAGCTSFDWFHQNEPDRPAPVTAAPGPDNGEPAAQGPRGPLSPAANAAAPPGGTRTGELMDCVTESCRINCSPKVKPQFRPKWCAQFKEPEQ